MIFGARSVLKIRRCVPAYRTDRAAPLRENTFV
jgi:hypothetical protein